MIKLLHAADLHLDSPFAALSPEQAAARRAEQRSLIDELVELCSRQQCDLMLLSGDLFDSDNAYGDTIDALIRAFGRCSAKIFIAPGNHDFFTPGCAYDAAAWPENVHIFKTQALDSVVIPELGCQVYGGAFTGRACPGLLEGFSVQDEGLVNLMVLHGEVDMPTSAYNPISQQQIAGSGLDYLALGHIHQASGLCRAGATAYGWPGCAMGRGFDETGPKGCYLVSLERGDVQLEFSALTSRRYEQLTVAAGDDPLGAITAALPPDTQEHIYRIVLTGQADMPDCKALYQALQDRFFSLTLRDRTTPRRDLWENAQDDTLKGLFLKQLQAAAAQGSSEDAVRLAAEITLALMEKREVPEI